MIGQTISHYRITQKLGSGGMGVVYKAEDTRLKRAVALKFLPLELTRDAEAKDRFEREAQAASALDHPNICTIHEIDEIEDGQLFICMGYYEGETLRKKIARGPLPVDEGIGFAIQVVEGLAKAHARGIVHRDIKPANLIVTKEGVVKIVDFGLATLAGITRITKTGTTSGTATYMSPEQTRGAEVDHRTDIWSLGVVLYEILSGQLPFRAEHEAATIYHILNEDPPVLSDLSQAIPESLSDLVNKALKKDVSQRYQQMEEFLHDLRLVQEDVKRPTSAVQSSLKAIAVLPFDNISPDKENEYFSDGLTEEIITSLSKIRSLKVISRTSIMHYKGAKKPLKQIANSLQVQYILEGSVRKHGNDLRITAQLIDATQDAHLWADKFRVTVEDVFDVQERVAAEIAGALKVELTPVEQAKIKKRYTEDTEAYQLYLKGRFYWNKRTEEGFKRAVEFFEQAIERDPDYALAYTGLADSYTLLGDYCYLPPHDSLPKARAAATKSLEIDDKLAEGHASLAHVKMLYDWDWSGADRDFMRAIEIDPSYATAHQWYALSLAVVGRLEEARSEIHRAQELDPLSLIINTDVGLISYYTQDYDQAINQFRKTLEIDANFVVTHFALGLAYVEKGTFDEAIAEFQRAVTLSRASTVQLSALGHAHAASGDRVKAQKALTELQELSNRRYVSPYGLATIYAGLAENDRALEWLQKAYEDRSAWLIHLHLRIDPRLDSVRSDPRYAALLKDMGLEK